MPGSHAGERPESGRLDVSEASVGELMGTVSRDLSTLVRQELELAKAELKVEAAKAGKGAGLFGGAGFAGYMVLLFLSIALWWALENVMDTGLAALIVGVLWAILAGVLFVMGRNEMRQVRPTPERTVQTLKDVPDALRGR
jgi:hypothetical protein